MMDDIDAPITTEEKLEYELGFVQELDECDGYEFLHSVDNDVENIVKNLKYHCDHMVTIHHELCVLLGSRRDIA